MLPPTTPGWRAYEMSLDLGWATITATDSSPDVTLTVAEQAEPIAAPQFLVSVASVHRVPCGSARLRFALFLDVGTPPRTVGTSELDWLETSRLQSASPIPRGRYPLPANSPM